MARLILLSIVCLATIVVVNGDDNDGGMFQSMDPFSCRQLGQKCKGFPRCCGELVCLWTGNFNPIEMAFRLEDEQYWSQMLGGVCVQCVGEGLKCQRDAHCCDDLQCDKSSRLTINGKCRPLREDGRRCHTDDMCIGYCDKSWYELNGVCVGGGTIAPPLAPSPELPAEVIPVQPVVPVVPVAPTAPAPTPPTAEDEALNEALEGLLEP